MIVFVGYRKGTVGKPLPCIVLKRFANGRAYIQFENGQKKNVAQDDLRER